MRLVHLARASLARGITRGGLAGRKIRLPGAGAGTTTTLPRGVYAMPVLRDSWTTLQWLRELRRGHDERMVAVYFHLPDDELVHVGRYNEPHQAMAVSAAAAWVTRHPAGAEIVVPRAIPARAIRAVREVGQLVGWTDVPEAERKLHCLCDYCFPRGDRRFMRRIRAAYADGIAAQRAARTREETIAALGTLETPLERARGRLEPTKLLPLVRAPDAEVRTVVAALLGHFRAEQVQSPLELLLRDAHVDVRTRAGHALLRSLGPRRAAASITAHAAPLDVASFVEHLAYERHGAELVSALELCAARDASLRAVVARVARGHLEDADGSAALRRRLERLAREGAEG